MSTDFDRCFEQVLLGNRCATLLHKYQVDPDQDIWHVCTVDINDYYASYYIRLNRNEWTMTRVSR